MSAIPPGPESGRKALLRSVLLALLALLALEIGARWLAGPEKERGATPVPRGAAAQTLPGNPYLLYELAPGEWQVHGGTAHHNALGMRDRERGPKTRPRAMVIGDSSVYGFGVSDEQLFTSLLEERLQADVINAGVPGWSTVQARNMLEMRGLALEPDLLIIATLWSDNNFDSFVDTEVIASWRKAAGMRALLEMSALFRALDGLAARATGRRQPRAIQRIATDAPTLGRRRVPLSTYVENLEWMARTLHDRGGGVAFLMLANRMDVQHRPGPLVWAPYREAMRAMARRWNAPLVELPEVFPRSGGHSLFLDEIHPNVRGHEVISRALEDALRAAGWPQAPLVQPLPEGPLPQIEDPYEGQGVELGLVEPARPQAAPRR